MLPPALSRRSFLASSAALAGGTLLGAPAVLRSAPDTKILKIALVGCGGRGNGAAAQALKADPHVQLVALADIAPEAVEKSLSLLRAEVTDHPEKIAPTVRKFVGLDAIDHVLDSDVDVVLLTTPPGFRAEHFEKAVNAGKHCFFEKPVAVDGPTYRRFLAAARESKKKGLGAQSGFCWRSSLPERETQAKIRAGEIGEVRATFGSYIGGTPWVKKRQPNWTDLEWQLRNWLYFTWLSGDILIEQAIHNVDKMCWAFNDADPVAAIGVGGRSQRVEEEYGQVYDHFAVTYEFAGGARGQIVCRQQAGCFNEVRDAFYGSKGQVDQVSGNYNSIRDLKGETLWRYKGPKNDMYQTEHDEFFASVRAGQPLNFAEVAAHSTMVGLLGRMAAYSGQRITWEDAIASKEDLRPAGELKWDMKLPAPPVAVPGRTKFS